MEILDNCTLLSISLECLYLEQLFMYLGRHMLRPIDGITYLGEKVDGIYFIPRDEAALDAVRARATMEQFAEHVPM